ncbi:MAG TPA: hypothetical protein VFH73_07210 [Polyangia bacterium]|jgi:hypothetical protein|nr:hypothetical protein [Polyangia bacterium]
MATESQETSPANSQRMEDGGMRTFGQRVDHINDTAQQAWTRTRDAFSDIKDTLDIDRRVKRHPYGTVAAAVGIGYVLGGGLFSRLTARILGVGLRLGVRLAALPFIKEELMTLVSAAAEGGDESGSKSRKSRQANTNKGR